MAFGGFNQNNGGGAPMSEINMVPLIDVMLVLLVIFIITAPLLTHAVKVDLPRASSTPNITRPDNVQVAIDASGHVYWNGEVLDPSGWRARMQAAAQQNPQPEVHVRADGNVAYRKVAQVMSDAAQHGLTRIGFITAPGQN
jgi:biopolymer transport protein ExbD